jgi:hypothetical protein
MNIFTDLEVAAARDTGTPPSQIWPNCVNRRRLSAIICARIAQLARIGALRSGGKRFKKSHTWVDWGR